MRTQEEIVQRIEEIQSNVSLGEETADLAIHLTRENVKPFLKKDADLNEWETKELTKDNIIKGMLEYLDFAFDRAINHRGISAGRSIDHMRAWLWLLEDAELLAFAEDEENYAMYGVPILKKISVKYGKPIPDKIRDWKDGEPCSRGCEMGCGL